ncbi:KTSC domain-containing protein [Paenibacillus filicis]|uniref:KTSC domain-containing protein n=1 Tax=Paenibacillus gyeongsangnamensis TaxID=3388067 RepID=A0ABT4Q729_9BACL|nr:KTSC domain-containing protein [Paenibacillus filicis]MCZ8512639.1 KTSC domain-containing protein [Paenibacillus filicis]
MKMIPIGSKQITFVAYDDQAAQMHIQYHTGQTYTCCGVNEDQVQLLLQSPNPYDLIVRMTGKNALPTKV